MTLAGRFESSDHVTSNTGIIYNEITLKNRKGARKAEFLVDSIGSTLVEAVEPAASSIARTR